VAGVKLAGEAGVLIRKIIRGWRSQVLPLRETLGLFPQEEC